MAHGKMWAEMCVWSVQSVRECVLFLMRKLMCAARRAALVLPYVAESARSHHRPLPYVRVDDATSSAFTHCEHLMRIHHVSLASLRMPRNWGEKRHRIRFPAALFQCASDFSLLSFQHECDDARPMNGANIVCSPDLFQHIAHASKRKCIVCFTFNVKPNALIYLSIPLCHHRTIYGLISKTIKIIPMKRVTERNFLRDRDEISRMK